MDLVERVVEHRMPAVAAMGLSILLLEDSPLDAELVIERLRSDNVACRVRRVENRIAFEAALVEDDIDLVLSDFSLPGFDGLSALAIARQMRPSLPFIFVTGALGEERAVDTVRLGATDYVHKDRLDRLAPAVARALRESEARSARERAEREREEAIQRERSRSEQLRGLTAAGLSLIVAPTIDDIVRALAEQARALLGCHQAASTLTMGLDRPEAIHFLSISERYAREPGSFIALDATIAKSIVLEADHGVRKTSAEIADDPYLRSYAAASDRPPMRNWLAAPLVGREGEPLGVVQLSDRYEGDFTVEDEAVLVQLARIASIAAQNRRLVEVAERERARAEQANRAKDDFIATISHELRTPLSAILGWARMLRSGLAEDKRARAIETIERNARVQAQLVEDVLDVSRIIAGKLRIEVTNVDLIRVMEAAIDTVRPAAESKAVTLKVALDPETGTVPGDPDRLQQVIWNLLSNAIKFTPRSGTVEICSERCEDVLRITVRDSGEGIAAEFLPHVFERFRQAELGGARGHGGLGLGLAIAKHIVELHRGTIRADSEGAGRGALFTVELPAASARRDRSLVSTSGVWRSSELPVPEGIDGLRVLVIEDEQDTRDLLQSLLETCRAHVRAVSRASEAMEALAADLPDVILSDIGLPEEDGYKLIKRIRALPPEKGGRLPVIALTAYARAEDRTRALLSGFSSHVPKPVEPSELLAVMAHVTGRMR